MKKLLYILCILIAIGCQRGTVEAVDYLKYIDNPSNGLIAKEEIGDFIFSAQYRPPQYEIIKNVGINKSNTELSNALKEVDSMQYFLLRIEAKQKNTDVLNINIYNSSQYQQRIAYLSSDILNDLKLVDGKDTLNCIIHHWERSYHITNFSNIILGFELKSPNEINGKTLIYEDHIFGVGKVQLSISKKDIASIPNISI